jgi:hypothetical protein
MIRIVKEIILLIRMNINYKSGCNNKSKDRPYEEKTNNNYNNSNRER